MHVWWRKRQIPTYMTMSDIKVVPLGKSMYPMNTINRAKWM